MAIPKHLAYWQKFVDWFSQDNAYWYFPKGHVLNLTMLLSVFTILKKYEGGIWSDMQKQLQDDLSDAGLYDRKVKPTTSDSTARARMWKVVFSTLGFAWVQNNEKIYITSAGNKFLESKKPEDVITHQVQRYQIHSYAKKINPHVFLLQVLLSVDGYISNDEYILFVSRARSHEELSLVLEFIKKWRKLSKKIQNKIRQKATSAISNLSGRRTSLVNTIDLNKGYALSYLTFCSYLEKVERDDIFAKIKSRSKVMKIVKQFHFVEYKNQKDWIAYYGEQDTLPTKEQAVEYYTDTNQTKKLQRIDKSAAEILIQEKELEDALVKNVSAIEKGLKLIGRQFSTITGPMDLLCTDSKNNYVVIELKKGRASDKVVGQILRYMGFVKTQMLKPKQSVRGIIIAREMDKKIQMALLALHNKKFIQLQTFVVENKKLMKIKISDA